MTRQKQQANINFANWHKLLLSLTLSFIIALNNSSAQPAISPIISFGESNIHFVPTSLYTTASFKPVFGGSAGGIIDFNVQGHFYLQTGIKISLKGSNRDFSYFYSDSMNEKVIQNLRLFYLETPFNVLIKTKSADRNRIFIGIGIVPSFILGGNNKLNVAGKYLGIHYDTTSNTKVISGNPLAGFDIGLNLEIGYELSSGIKISAFYTAGVNDIGLGGETDKNRIWGITCGYYLGKNKISKKESDELIDKSEIN